MTFGGSGKSIVAAALVTVSATSLGACASPAPTYMGIHTADSELESKLASKRELLEVARTILLLSAHDAGCFAAAGAIVESARYSADVTPSTCTAYAEEAALVSNRIGAESSAVPAPSELLSHLAKAAQSGNKDAQLALGIRFEEGRGVDRDLEKAKALYRLAAQDTGGQELVISRGFFGGLDRIFPDDSEPARSGREEALSRLAALGK